VGKNAAVSIDGLAGESDGKQTIVEAVPGREGDEG
jgi:hypothetical protein